MAFASAILWWSLPFQTLKPLTIIAATGGVAAIAGFLLALGVLCRSKGMLATKVLTMVTLPIGLATIAASGLVLYEIAIGRIYIAHPISQPPDFVAEPAPLPDPLPTPSPR